MHTDHRDTYIKHTKTFSPNVINEWEKMIEEWDANVTKKKAKDPYREPTSGTLYTISYLMIIDIAYQE